MDTGRQRSVDTKLMGESEHTTAIIALTKNGVCIAKKLGQSLESHIYISKRLVKDKNIEGQRVYTIDSPFINFVHQIFPKYKNLIFITATGIAVRAIAQVIKDKRRDPAVVVVDEQAKFAISLLSGHVGGANELTLRVADILDSTPVITTASDGKGYIGIDVLAKKLGLFIENFSEVKKVSSLLVDEEKVAVIFEPGLSRERFSNIGASAVFCKDVPKDAKAAIFVTDERVLAPQIPHIILRPKNIVLGIGARRGASYKELYSFLKRALLELNLSKHSIGAIFSIDIKKDEECINKLAELLGVPLSFYTKDELLEVEDRFPISPFVKNTVGVGAVARPSAYLGSSEGKEMGYYISNGITLAIYKRRTIWAG